MTTTDLPHDTIYISQTSINQLQHRQPHRHELLPLNLPTIPTIRTLKQHTPPPNRHTRTTATRAHNHTLTQTDQNRRLAAQHCIRRLTQSQTIRRRILKVGTTMRRFHLRQNNARCSQGCLTETNDLRSFVGQSQSFKLVFLSENSSRMPWPWGLQSKFNQLSILSSDRLHMYPTPLFEDKAKCRC